MLRAYVGRAFGLRQGRILPILQRSEARLRGTVQPASTDAACMDFTSLGERLLCNEIVASRRDVGHADRVQPVPYVVIFSGDHTGNDVAAPAATASPFPKGKPGPNGSRSIGDLPDTLRTFSVTTCQHFRQNCFKILQRR